MTNKTKKSKRSPAAPKEQDPSAGASKINQLQIGRMLQKLGFLGLANDNLVARVQELEIILQKMEAENIRLKETIRNTETAEVKVE